MLTSGNLPLRYVLAARIPFPLQAEVFTNDYKDFNPQPSDIEGWTGNQIVVFLERVQLFKTPLTPELSQAMGKTYALTETRNVELSSRYFGVGLRAKDTTVYQPTADLLGTVGRMKFVRPLYRYLALVDRKLALKTFEKNKVRRYSPLPLCDTTDQSVGLTLCLGLLPSHLQGHGGERFVRKIGADSRWPTSTTR